MKLQERGALKLDDAVNRYLGKAKLWSLTWNAAEATVRQVATHTAGLTTYDQACFPDTPECDTSYDTMIRRYGVIFWKPGIRFDYSNLGYGVLSAVVEHVSGKRFENFLHDELFEPLAMHECAAEASDDIAIAYDEHGNATLPHVEVAQGASSACCSADSLLKFAMFNLKDRLPGQRNPVISDAGIDAMHDQTVATDAPGQHYGLGWWIDDYKNGYRVVYDAGGTADSKALLYTIPSEDIAVVVLANAPALDSDKVVDRILAALLPKYALAFQAPEGTGSVSSPAVTPAAIGWPKGRGLAKSTLTKETNL
jgi:CubicO group peptidase (beta-lactamase class C family)